MLFSKISKALADDNRLKIIKFLSDGQKNVTQVADKLNVEENLASHHLRTLASLGFLKNEKKGREVYYRINDIKFINILRELKKSPAFKDIFEEALKK